MERRKGIITLLMICMLLFSIFAVLSRNLIAPVSSSGGAKLTGKVFDSVKDTDSDTKYDYLDIAVEIDVSSKGYYQIQMSRLLDPKNSTYTVYRGNGGNLNLGLQLLNLSFYGPELYGARFNVSAIGNIRLFDNYWNLIDFIEYAPLVHVYNYTDFDCRAVFTGKIYDKGIDTDADGLFNNLQIGVEINVTDPSWYGVHVSNVCGSVTVVVFNYSMFFLKTGFQIVNVTLNGAKICASHGNVSNVENIWLDVNEEGYYYTIAQMSGHPLNKTYNYNEFDPMAFFTGKILDEGINTDSDGLYDYLKISIEINVTDAGDYSIYFKNLFDNQPNWLYEEQSFYGEFKKGLHLINFTVYGPKIYGAHLNPMFIQYLCLKVSSGWEWITLEERGDVPLPTVYNYYEFESHAFFTGKIYDNGVDTDKDGLFDYLEVGVEVNVTETGKYGLSVGGLAEIIVGKEANQIGYYQYSEGNLNLGTHIINFTFPGPMIAYYHINPTHVTDLTLTEISPYYQLGYIQNVVLPTMYTYREFNSPLTDMQVEFTVYPNATVGVSGLVNQTHYYAPYYYPPKVNETISFSTSGDVTTGSVNGTMMLPEYPPSLHQFPFNSTTVNFASKYNDGILNAQLNATMNLPSGIGGIYPFNSSNLSFHSIYSDGTFNVDLYGDTEFPAFVISLLPFNLSDVTVLADYKDNKINGNITFHTVSGFPLGDVVVDFNGNKTEVSFSGQVTVIYGNYFGMEINATVLEQTLTQINSTIPGHGEHSLYNMTQGMVECTKLNTTKTPITEPLEGAIVDYNATIHGNFTKLLAYVLAGPYGTEETRSFAYAALDAALSSVNQAALTLNYYPGLKTATLHVTLSDDVKALWSNALELIPPTVPPLFSTMPPEYQEYYGNLSEALLKIANITAYAVENADISVDYSSVTQQLNVRLSLTANITRMKNEIIPILPDTVLPQYREFVESCTNTTYCTLDSLNITCNYVNGLTDFHAKWLLKGDFTAEINRMKHCYVEFLNLTSPYMINWQTRMINETEIDISNFKAELRLGEDWMTVKFEGLKIYSSRDEMDFVRFKLYRLFNMTSSSNEPPVEFEKLKITVTGCSNETHTILLYAPSSVPAPDITSLDYRTMMWENVKISSLKDLIFLVAYEEVVQHLGKTYYVLIFTNSTVSSFKFDPATRSVSFNVTGTGTGFCNVTIPRSLLYAKPYEWIVTLGGRVLIFEKEYNVTENSDYVFICLAYSHSTQLVEIKGTWVVAEFQLNMLIPVLIILSLIAAVIVVKQRRRLGKIKVRYQAAVNMFLKAVKKI